MLKIRVVLDVGNFISFIVGKFWGILVIILVLNFRGWFLLINKCVYNKWDIDWG